jgi:NAD(P)-dependent dehydrogenase (short-subunit alcohol dehydrogenase family)
LDVFVYNAGIALQVAIDEMEIDDFERGYAIKVRYAGIAIHNPRHRTY